DFQDMLAALLDGKVEFMVVGGMALAAHGHPRATKDIDIFVRASPENGVRIVAALKRFGAPLHGVTADAFSTPGLVLQLGVPPRRIDLTTIIDGVEFDEASSDVVTVELNGLRLPVIGRKSLIKNKRAAARPQDLVDVKVLEGRSSSRRTRTGKPKRK